MFFCVDSCGDIETFDTADKAKAAAESALQAERDDAMDGWSEEVTNIMWGKVLGTCELEFERPRTDDDHFVSSDCESVSDYHIVDIGVTGSNEVTRSYSAPEVDKPLLPPWASA